MDELRAISTFIRAAELGSFNKVAEAQGSTPQAVSKTIRQFEQHLGVRLFHRTTRNSTLTEEGQRCWNRSSPAWMAWSARWRGPAAPRARTRG
ncbi:helix-turn-helix domain-containing protein [Duganella margarita]|uniref:helix-turn-helix domain-containing protein n=1 Tax=Duganella margarita TaxID=2692170 RepID=UPI001E5C3628|nr:LysR family transcriptional regulator [Duganella margarita]